MAGYRNLPDRTAEALDPGGLAAHGRHRPARRRRLPDHRRPQEGDHHQRGGKNMSPANIEAQLKTSSPLIGQACCVGDRRPYNVALLVLDADFAPAWAAQQGIDASSLEALADDARVRAAVQEGIDAANAKLVPRGADQALRDRPRRLAARRRRADARR
jgi:long-subunit acyl-CoA synthetase (AMP-forming)